MILIHQILLIKKYHQIPISLTIDSTHLTSGFWLNTPLTWKLSLSHSPYISHFIVET